MLKIDKLVIKVKTTNLDPPPPTNMYMKFELKLKGEVCGAGEGYLVTNCSQILATYNSYK